jgi:solute carrier family 6 GABA transporter-like protein 1
MAFLRKVGAWLAPAPAKSEDGRDQWPSRAAFLLAAMGGCAGQGNLLRYPSVLYNNYGLQWFVPYLLAVFLIAIPALILEVSIGQAYRGGETLLYCSALCILTLTRHCNCVQQHKSSTQSKQPQPTFEEAC